MIKAKIASNIIKVEEIIDKVNSLNRGRERQILKTLDERVELLIVAMTIIEKSFNDFIAFKRTNKRYNEKELVNIDYKISEYARRLYNASKNVMSIMLIPDNKKAVDDIFMKYRVNFMNVSKKMLEISARWSIENTIAVYEFDMPEDKKAFPKRKPLLEEVVFFTDRLMAHKMKVELQDDIKPKRIIFAVQPNSGKSFVANVFSLLSIIHHLIYHQSSGILRMSNNAGNAWGFSEQIKAMLENDKITLIFPELRKYFSSGKPKILQKVPAGEWKTHGLDPRIRASHFAIGREAAINSIRIFVALIIDDLSDGYEQMENDEAHQKMTEKYHIDMESRKEGGDIPELFFGTMFNEYDLPNTEIRKMEERGQLIQSKVFPNTRHTQDFNTIVVLVDCYDDKGESVAPDLISTEELKEKQESLKPHQFDLVYRQMRTSREPRVFSYDNLNKYDEINEEELSSRTIAVIDPTRKSGSDWFSMPVFRFNSNEQLWYLTNAIFEQKSLGVISDPKNEFLDKICNFIIDNKVTELYIENNTSNTIGTLLSEQLKRMGYTSLKVDEHFAHARKKGETKLSRILAQEATIINNIKFPAPRFFPVRHPVSEFMDKLTRFDSKSPRSSRNNPDDAPDSLAMFSDKYLFNTRRRSSSITGISKSSIF